MSMFVKYLYNITHNKLILNYKNGLYSKYVLYIYIYNHKYDLFNCKDLQLFSTTDKTYVYKYLFFLKNNYNSQMKLLTDLCGADFLDKTNRFNVIYNLLSLNFHNRHLVSIWNNELEFINSISTLFFASVWYEREAWDLFGIVFKNNNDLRRILTDYGFNGHPLRKDFPLTGYIELGYDLRINSIIYKEITLVQEFREFDTISPWDFIINTKPLV